MVEQMHSMQALLNNTHQLIATMLTEHPLRMAAIHVHMSGHMLWEHGHILFIDSIVLVTTAVLIKLLRSLVVTTIVSLEQLTPGQALYSTTISSGTGSSALVWRVPAVLTPTCHGLINKTLSETTTENIELRLCGDDSPTADEDVPIKLIELYFTIVYSMCYKYSALCVLHYGVHRDQQTTAVCTLLPTMYLSDRSNVGYDTSLLALLLDQFVIATVG